MIASDFVPVAMVAAAIAPALLSLWLVVAADSRPEPARVVLIALLLGVLSAMVAVVVELWLQRHLPVARGTLLAVVEKAVLLAAIPEEVLKVSLIAALVLRSRDFDEPMDGVVYGTAVGLGFAMLENLFYVAAGPNWQGVAVLRGVLSVPLHGRGLHRPRPVLRHPWLRPRRPVAPSAPVRVGFAGPDGAARSLRYGGVRDQGGIGDRPARR
jgi:RsiW-degrading membrane proteinase PrsW (M82 family)